MESSIYNSLVAKQKEGKRMIAILIDPDKANKDFLANICAKADDLEADLILIGGSLLTDGNLDDTIGEIQGFTKIPTVLFPGSSSQITDKADGILFLSLLSSRNPEMLIGQQVIAAPYLKKTSLQILSTAYLLIDSGAQTTASYMSNSNPIPSNKPEIAASTALAGEYLGMSISYLDGGSGAESPVPSNMIKKVRSYVSNLLFIGGGINTVEKAANAFEAGADLIVVGNAIEKNPSFLSELKSLLQK